MEDPGTQTRIVPILERQVVVRQLDETRLALLAREASRLKRGNLDGQDAMKSVARVLDIIEKAVVQPEDVEWLTEQMIDGKLALRDLFPALSVFGEPEVTAPAVRRGRPTRK